jgi:hypothetical protein
MCNCILKFVGLSQWKKNRLPGWKKDFLQEGGQEARRGILLHTTVPRRIAWPVLKHSKCFVFKCIQRKIGEVQILKSSPRLRGFSSTMLSSIKEILQFDGKVLWAKRFARKF